MKSKNVVGGVEKIVARFRGSFWTWGEKEQARKLTELDNWMGENGWDRG